MIKVVVLIAFIVVSGVGWLLCHSTYPAFAFAGGLWGGILLAATPPLKGEAK